MQKLKRLYYLPIILLLASCMGLKDYYETEKEKAIQGETNIVYLEEFKLIDLTEDKFIALAKARGYAIEQCRENGCIFGDRHRPRVIKLTQPLTGEVQVPHFKHGPDASTYFLLNYKAGNRYLIEESVLYFYRGELVHATFTRPDPQLLIDYKKRYPNFEQKEERNEVSCKVDGVPQKRVESVMVTQWPSNLEIIGLHHKYGDKIEAVSCRPMEKWYNYLMITHANKYRELVRYSRQHR